MTPRVLIVGSGPTGATYARQLLEQLPDVSVLMVEAGPVVTRPIGMNVKNVPDPEEQAAARLASQGRSHESGVSGIPGGVVVEGTNPAGLGTHLIGRAADGSPGMPAAAGATCVGGQGVHWTCATPAPTGPERIAFIDEAEWAKHRAAGGLPDAHIWCGVRGGWGARTRGSARTSSAAPVRGSRRRAPTTRSPSRSTRVQRVSARRVKRASSGTPSRTTSVPLHRSEPSARGSAATGSGRTVMPSGANSSRIRSRIAAACGAPSNEGR